MAAFRLRHKHIALTWARCDGEHVDFFTKVDDFLPVAKAIIAKEHHEDGGTHFHGYFQLESSPDVRITDDLDVNSVHPNIRTLATKLDRTKWCQYMRKENDWIEFNFDGDDHVVPDAHTPSSVSSEEILLKAGTTSSWKEFLAYGFDNKIDFRYLHAIWSACNDARGLTITDDTEIRGTINTPVLVNKQFTDGMKNLVIQGPTGCGKTVWAKKNMPKPALWISHIDHLRHFQIGYHVSIIFDDMCFNGDEHGKGQWPISSQIHLVDWDNLRAIHCRYQPATIPAGTYKCFTCNHGRYPLSQDPAVQRRVENVYIPDNY